MTSTALTVKTIRASRPNLSTDASTAISMLEYGGLQTAYDHFNRMLFGGELLDALIVYQRKPHMNGHFYYDRYSARDGTFKKPELALNPDSFVDRTDDQIVSTLVHEQAHFWQAMFGQPSKRGYHNKEWAAKMKSIGLMPSNTGAVGGRETGSQMTHYILPDGPFAKAFAEIAARGWHLNLQSTIVACGSKAPSSKLKFTCPSCGVVNAWGKPGSELVCRACLINSLINLPWLDRDMAGDLLKLIGRATMLSSQSDPGVAASFNGELVGASEC